MSPPSAGMGGQSHFPLPFLLLPPRPNSRSRRLWQRYSVRVAATKVANAVLSSLNTLFFSFSCPSCDDPIYISFQQARFCSSYVSRVLSFIYSRCLSYVRRLRLTPLSDDIFELLFSSLSDFSMIHSLQATFGAHYALQPSAMPIIASRVALPSKAGTCRLLDVLPSTIVATYSEPGAAILRSSPVVPVPRAVLFASRCEYLKLVSRMVALGMLTYTLAPAAVNGVFGVHKDADALRLIIDARPANALFSDPPPVQLPTPDLMCGLHLPPGCVLYSCKADIDNFYHRLRLPIWLQCYFALPAVPASVFGMPADSAPVYPCCTTLPMGWSHSVYLAQIAHEHILNTLTPLAATDRISHATDKRVNRPRHQAYIDDLSIFGTDCQQLRQLLLQYVSVMDGLGLPVKPSKLVLPTSNGMECLGVYIDGQTGTIGVSANKLRHLSALTLALLCRRRCTGKELARLVGAWTWCCLPARPALAVFNAVYRFILTAGNRTFLLWPSVRRELKCIVGLAPLLYTNINAQCCSRVIATDASSTGQGVVSCQVDPQYVANTLSNNHSFSTDPQYACSVVQSLSWRRIVSSRWRHVEHINVLELRSICTAIRWLLSFPSVVCCRILSFCDSQVAVYCLRKGRTSAFSLLRCIRHINALLLASGLQLSSIYIPSMYNPADGPSRL